MDARRKHSDAKGFSREVLQILGSRSKQDASENGNRVLFFWVKQHWALCSSSGAASMVLQIESLLAKVQLLDSLDYHRPGHVFNRNSTSFYPNSKKLFDGDSKFTRLKMCSVRSKWVWPLTIKFYSLSLCPNEHLYQEWRHFHKIFLRYCVHCDFWCHSFLQLWPQKSSSSLNPI